ncbi:MAG: hypothetical protein ACR2OG_16900 [Gemmatimonadaceae bacterium]
MRKTIGMLALGAIVMSTPASRAAAQGDSVKKASAQGDSTKKGSGMSGMAGMKGMNPDPDKKIVGTGVPAGFMGRTDSSRFGKGDIQAVRYTNKKGRWEIKTGPAHIVYSDKDTKSGVYAVSATIEQLEKPAHPEAFGLFVGGQNLDTDQQKYTYLLVRGDGKYLIRVRDGKDVNTITEWTASPAVPKANRAGKATYKLKIHMAPDTAHFYVNGKMVQAVPKSQISADGIAGLRVNHNLHVVASPVEVK